MDMHRDFFQPIQHGAELAEVLVGRMLESTGMCMYVMPSRLTLAASSGRAFSWVWRPRLTMWRTPGAWMSASYGSVG